MIVKKALTLFSLNYGHTASMVPIKVSQSFLLVIAPPIVMASKTYYFASFFSLFHPGYLSLRSYQLKINYFI